MTKKVQSPPRRKKRRNPDEVTDDQVKRRLTRDLSVEDLTQLLGRKKEEPKTPQN